jgi:hypothetical protein
MIIDVRVSLSALILGGEFFTGVVLATALTSDSTALNVLLAEVHLSLGRVLASRATLTTIYTLGNVDYDLHHSRRTI